MLGPRGIRFTFRDQFHRRHDMIGEPVRMWIALLLLGCISMFIGLGIISLHQHLYHLRLDGCRSFQAGGARWAAWIGSSALLALASALLVRIEPNAAGTGLPEVKSTLSGVVLFQSMSLKVLCIKPVALSLALASGLSIGKEGPLIHSFSCVASWLASSWLFSSSGQLLEQRRLCLMMAACALGVVCTFGAPIGGALFAIEITADHYQLDHLPRTFFCVTMGLLFMTYVLRPVLLEENAGDPLALFSTEFPPHSFSPLVSLLIALQAVLLACLVRRV